MTSLSRVPTDLQGFLAWENCQPDRYELIAGAVRPREGGTRAHDLIAVTIGALLHAAVGRRCYVHGSCLKVVSPDGMVAYPDVLVRCGPLVAEATDCDDPVLIVEVLSLLTRAGALIHKRWAYQAIPSLRHLLYVDAARLKVELATRSEDGSWHSVFLEGPDAIVRLDALHTSLPLAEVYEGTGLA